MDIPPRHVPRSNREWMYWGRSDPYFGVLTIPGRDKDGSRPWSAAEVFESGRQYFEAVRQQWSSYGMGTAHCAEIGCGSGRLTAQLARHFARVTAIDVSPDQLRVARDLVGDQASRVEWHLITAPQIPAPDKSCDGVFSCEVIQHIDSAAVCGYIAEAFRVLAPGSTLCLHSPVKGVGRETFRSSGVRNRLLRALRALGRRRMMIYRKVVAADMLAMLEAAGFTDVELRVFGNLGHARQDGHVGYDSYFFARRPVGLGT